MREIKFRAWDENPPGDEHTMLFFDLGDSGYNLPWIYANCKVMQYTGLKDKNGVEIYEGDYCLSNHYLFGEQEQGLVEYTHTGQYVLAQGSFKTSVHDLVFNDWKLEIIGNIYENPELLEKSND